MSQHELNRPELLASIADATESKVSNSIKRTNHARLAFQISIITNDLIGNVKLQTSLDDETYVDIPSSTVTALGVDQPIVYEVDEPCSVYYRVAVNRAAGTYTLKVIAHLSDANS